MTCTATEARRITQFAACTSGGQAGPFIRLHSMARYEADAAYRVQREGLPQWLLAYTLGGQGRLLYEGAAYTLRRGTVFLIDCAMPQEYGADGGDWDFLWVHFSGPLADQYARYITARQGVASTGAADFISQWQILHELAVRDGMESEALLSAAMYQLLTQLLAARPADERIEAAVAYMQEHYAEPVTIEKLAKEACMSPFYFQRRFKEATGLTPHVYVNRCRVSRAKHLLVTTGLPVSAVAEQTGFATGSHFTQTFRRLTGFTPMDYRRAL